MQWRAFCVAIMALMFLVTACPSAGAEDGLPDDLKTQTPEQLAKGIEQKHPATYYALAAKLFADDKKDDAVFWFYAGQLRYRFHLAVNRKLDPAGDPALFAALSETVGRPLNEYAFGDLAHLAKTIDKVLEWDAKHDNAFTSKKENEEKHKSIRAGLLKLRDYIVKNADDIKRQRTENGLKNR